MPSSKDLRDIVTVQEVTRVKNEMGEVVETWRNVGSRQHASIKPLRARERLRLDADAVADVTHVVTMRYFRGLTSTNHRLMNAGRILDISGLVDLNNLHEWWEATCNEVQA